MDQLFGDAITAMPTPAQHAEVESLMSARSPVPSLDIRRGGLENLSADNAIPGLDINPPANNGKSQLPNGNENEPRSEGIGGWIARMVTRGRGRDMKGGDREPGAYRRLDQEDE